MTAAPDPEWWDTVPGAVVLTAGSYVLMVTAGAVHLAHPDGTMLAPLGMCVLLAVGATTHMVCRMADERRHRRPGPRREWCDETIYDWSAEPELVADVESAFPRPQYVARRRRSRRDGPPRSAP